MSHFITYLALEEVAAVSAGALADRYRSLYGEEAYSIQTAPDDSGETAGEAFVVSMDQMPVTVMFVDQPLPVDAYQEALALDLVWSEAPDAMRGHKAHVIVALVNDPQEHLDNLNGAAAVTLVAGALATLLPTAAVISTDSRVIMKPDLFGPLAVGLAKHEIPVALWVAMAFDRQKDAHGQDIMRVATYGLLPFIGRELECRTATVSATAVAGWLNNLCHHLVRNGPVIKDNDLTSLTPHEMVRATYRAEGFRQGLPIIEFNLDETVPFQAKLDHAGATPAHPQDRPRMAAPEPMPVQDYDGAHDARARPQTVVFGKRGTLKTAAGVVPATPQTKGPARWPGLGLFARK